MHIRFPLKRKCTHILHKCQRLKYTHHLSECRSSNLFVVSHPPIQALSRNTTTLSGSRAISPFVSRFSKVVPCWSASCRVKKEPPNGLGVGVSVQMLTHVDVCMSDQVFHESCSLARFWLVVDLLCSSI